jgi:L-rhamnonate dehydratase
LPEIAVEIICEDGSVGIGVAPGGKPACCVINEAFAPLLRGRDSADIEQLWDLMFLESSMHTSEGLGRSALSGVDLALWDLAAQRARVPVYLLLAPKATSRVKLYATGPRPDIYVASGFSGAKVCLPYAPIAGKEGFEKNVEFLRMHKSTIGPGRFLSVDCFMSLEPSYAVELYQATKSLHLRFYEEILLPWYQPEELRLLRRKGIPVAGGENANPLELRRLLSLGAVDILQPELTRCGGLTETLRLVRDAKKQKIRVIAHRGGIFAYHLAAAVLEDHLAEYVFEGSDGCVAVPTFGGLLSGEPLPKDGEIEAPGRPGWGIDLDPGATLVTF